MASSAVKPEMRSSTSISDFLRVFTSSRASSSSASLRERVSSFFSMLSVLRSRVSSFCWRRRSCFWRSERRSLTSFSYSLRAFRISSLASTSASRFLLSALLMDSLMMRFASSSALPISFSATFFRYWLPRTKNTTAATAKQTMPTMTVVTSIDSENTSTFSFLFLTCCILHKMIRAGPCGTALSPARSAAPHDFVKNIH